ncbi:hypothetical protein BDR04DRAFT_1005161, partial [Suillus decipiens]
CHCPNALSSDIQLFRHGFFPASFNRPKTAFTFRVLDDFLLDNLLQQAPANDLKHVSTPCSGNAISASERNYIDKACHIPYIQSQIRSDLIDPASIRTTDLIRIKHPRASFLCSKSTWRQLKTMKWHGFGHRSNDPKAGDLTLFCPACPQPGINISMSGDDSFNE